MSWACDNCNKKRHSDLHPYTLKLLHVLAMQAGGYQYERNDLSQEEWIDLGRVKRELDPPTLCPLMTKGKE